MTTTLHVPLGRGNLVAYIDPVDERLLDHFWHVDRGANTFYAVHQEGQGKDRQRWWMHRVILGLPPYQPGGNEVDHLDGNGLNNRRSNLRIVTHQGNATNRINTRKPRRCPVCQQTYQPTHARSQYCSSQCFGRRPGNPAIRPGSRNPNARLDETKVRAIRAAQGTVIAKELATTFTVSESLIYQVWHRKIWQHVE